MSKFRTSQLISHLQAFLTKNPQISKKVDEIFQAQLNLSEKFSNLNTKLQTESQQSDIANENLQQIEQKISILQDEISTLVKNLRDLIKIYQPQDEIWCNLSGDLLSNVEKFIQDCEKISELIAQFDLKNFFGQLKTKFSELKELFSRRAEQFSDFQTEQSQVDQFLMANQQFVSAAFALLTEICQMNFPDLIKDLKSWR